MKTVSLEEFMPTRTPSVNPAKHPDEVFELWSIPAFDDGRPEILAGAEIGSSKKCVEPGDVLLSRIVPHIRRAWIVEPSTDSRQIASGEWMIFRGTDFDANYLRHVLISDPFHAQFMQTVAGVGGSLLRARPESVKAIKIPLPPLEEQKRIAGILDQADALRRLRARALDKLKTLGQAIFYEMFGDELQSGNRLKLADLIEVRSSLDDPKLPENASLPHVGPEHISSGSGIVDWVRVRTCAEDGVTSGKYVFQKGDVLFSKIRPYLNKVAMGDRKGMCSADMYALHVLNESISSRFLHFILGSRDFLSYADTVSNRANIPKMNRTQLLAYTTPVPTLAAQQEFEATMAKLDIQANLIRNAKDISDQLFGSLQAKAFSGRLASER
ncbi:MAG: restriction endonuclease subunit S [Roseovarius confluentis]|jgi:type I restriction enzyme S subunit